MIDIKEKVFLKDWILRYVKNKDLMMKKIISTNDTEHGFIVVKKDSEQQFFIIPSLKDLSSLTKEIKEYKHNKSVACFHTKENFDILIKQWSEYVELSRNFTIYFVNPFSKSDRVLSLSPYTHQLIADDESLVTGLKTMSETVEFTTEDEVKKIISS